MSTNTKTVTPDAQTKNEWAKDDSVAVKYARAEAATRPYADIFMEKSNVASTSSDIHVFDIGCGTGAVEAALYGAIPKEKWHHISILGGDVSEDMLDYMKSRAEKEGWPGVKTENVNGADAKRPDGTFTHVFANAIIFHLPLGSLQKCFDQLQPGGFVGITTWAHLAWYPYVEKVAKQLPEPPHIPSMEEFFDLINQGNPWYDPKFVEAQLKESGFEKVEVETIKITPPCGTPAQFCETMYMPLKFMQKFWQEEKREKIFKDISDALLAEITKEAGGEDELMYLQMTGIVGTGRKPQ